MSTYDGRRWCPDCKRNRAFVGGRCVFNHPTSGTLRPFVARRRLLRAASLLVVLVQNRGEASREARIVPGATVTQSETRFESSASPAPPRDRVWFSSLECPASWDTGSGWIDYRRLRSWVFHPIATYHWWKNPQAPRNR